MAQLLIDKGADKNIKDDDGKKPIDWANSSEMKALLGGQDGSGKRSSYQSFLKSNTIAVARVLPLGFAFLPKMKPDAKMIFSFWRKYSETPE